MYVVSGRRLGWWLPRVAFESPRITTGMSFGVTRVNFQKLQMGVKLA